MSDKAKVFFAELKDAADCDAGVAALDKLWAAAGFKALPAKGKPFAIKMHFGDKGNHRTVGPAYARRLGELVKKAKGQPYATDTCTL